MAYDPEIAQQELAEAISSVLTRHGLMTNRWILVTEVIDQDGGRSLGSFSSDDLRAWDTLGMLHYVLEQDKGVIHQDMNDDGDGD